MTPPLSKKKLKDFIFFGVYLAKFTAILFRESSSTYGISLKIFLKNSILTLITQIAKLGKRCSIQVIGSSKPLGSYLVDFDYLW
jgi:hypothetical protein